jgi:hypothetical protein
VAEALGVSEEEVRRQFSVLRHCELARAEKRGNEVYLVPWVLTLTLSDRDLL